MGDVEAILQAGKYVDWRGRRWERTDEGEYTQWWSEDEWPCIEHADMRLLIQRDLHRAECPGLAMCDDHPVPSVAKATIGGWVASPPLSNSGDLRPTFAEAIAAAHNMTGEKE